MQKFEVVIDGTSHNFREDEFFDLVATVLGHLPIEINGTMACAIFHQYIDRVSSEFKTNMSETVLEEFAKFIRMLNRGKAEFEKPASLN
jgi:hypothetical protein